MPMLGLIVIWMMRLPINAAFLVRQNQMCVVEAECWVINPYMVRAHNVRWLTLLLSASTPRSRGTLVKAFVIHCSTTIKREKKHKDTYSATLICRGWHSRFVNSRKGKNKNNLIKCEKKEEKNGAKTLGAKWFTTCFNEPLVVPEPSDSVSCI